MITCSFLRNNNKLTKRKFEIIKHLYRELQAYWISPRITVLYIAQCVAPYSRIDPVKVHRKFWYRNKDFDEQIPKIFFQMDFRWSIVKIEKMFLYWLGLPPEDSSSHHLVGPKHPLGSQYDLISFLVFIQPSHGGAVINLLQRQKLYIQDGVKSFDLGR